MNTSPQSWLGWKTSRNTMFSDPTGFLSITSLVWLTKAPQEIAGLSGSWYATERTIYVIDSSSGEHSWNLDSLGDAEIIFDGLKVELVLRGGSPVVRPRDPNAAMLKEFSGVQTFDYNPDFRVEAQLEKTATPIEVVVGSVVQGLTHAYVSQGFLTFEYSGENYQLTAFDKSNSEDLLIYFKDDTSGKSTYSTGRSVTAYAQNDGTYIIDFNFSGNFPCAYTDFATCPIAPPENKLPFAISVGESKPPTRITYEGIKDQVSV